MARYDTGLASATSKYQSLKTISAKADAAAMSSAIKDREILEMLTLLATNNMEDFLERWDSVLLGLTTQRGVTIPRQQ
eukprot:15231208-Heterocapsa_arctica.AAC.1